jgi:uncharacterized surface protein with fasciclin (FAS1) repeats
MKKLYFILTIILLAVTNTLQAQNDSIYFWKSGTMIHKQSIKTVDLDSITFKAPDVNPNPSTLYALLNGNPNLSLFVRAIDVTGLSAPLNGSGSFTIFAPDNQAFLNAGLTAAVIDALSASELPALKELLLNHFVFGGIQSSDFQNNSYIKTLGKGSASLTNTLSMFVSTTSGVRLNGISDVTAADIQATNGIIHVVNNVITLPTTISHLAANPNFSSLLSLITRTDQLDNNFVGILSSTVVSPFTVFAPTNSAFNSLDLELAPSGIAGVSANNITDILKYHIVTGANVLSSSLFDGQFISTYSGQNIQVLFTLSLGARIRDAQNRLSPFISLDIQCSNGVIHALGGVLLPTF